MRHHAISLFASIFENEPDDVLDLDWSALLAQFRTAADEPLAGKEDQILFAPTRFNESLRRKANAQPTGLVLLDVDATTPLADAIEVLARSGIQALLSTTATHRPPLDKYRVVLELSEPVSFDAYPLVWSSISNALGIQADPSKRGAESLFYFPGRYESCPDNRFVQFDGAVLGPEAWIDLAPPDPKYLPEEPAEPPKPRRRLGRAPEIDFADPYRNRLIAPERLHAMLASTSAHDDRYKFLCSVVGRARAMGYPISQAELIHTYNGVDLIGSRRHQSEQSQRKLRADAEKALVLI